MISINRLSQHAQRGISLIELMVVIAIMGVIASLGMSMYTDYTMSANISKAITEIRLIDVLIRDYKLTKRVHPDDLSVVGVDFQDPWGNDYQYYDISGGGKQAKSKARKDKNLTPINNDFDLYSMGPDGDSVAPLTSPKSHDDIVRANNGRYVGSADGF